MFDNTETYWLRPPIPALAALALALGHHKSEHELVAQALPVDRTHYRPRFLDLSRSLDHHYVNASSITCPTTIIGVLEDFLVPPSQLTELASRIAGPCELSLLSSIYGHDAFLEDQSLIAPIVKRALA